MSSSPQVVVAASSSPEKASTKQAERSTRSGFPKFPPLSPVKLGSNIETPITPISPLSARSEFSKDETAKVGKQKPSPASPKKYGTNTPSPPLPNLILPTWADTFHTPPRSSVPSSGSSKITKAFKFMSYVLFAEEDRGKGKKRARESGFDDFGRDLPKAWDVVDDKPPSDLLRGCKKVVVIGIRGWFPGKPRRYWFFPRKSLTIRLR
jgi:hypothetical protein